jgi:hypothetical protein
MEAASLSKLLGGASPILLAVHLDWLKMVLLGPSDLLHLIIASSCA